VEERFRRARADGFVTAINVLGTGFNERVKPITWLTAQASYDINDRLSINFEGRNLLDAQEQYTLGEMKLPPGRRPRLAAWRTSRVEKIDAHMHLHEPSPEFVRAARRQGFKLLTINVDSPDFPPLEVQQRVAVQLKKSHPHDLAFAASFPVDRSGEPGWWPGNAPEPRRRAQGRRRRREGVEERRHGPARPRWLARHDRRPAIRTALPAARFARYSLAGVTRASRTIAGSRWRR
jgi:hypothetical protein